MNETAQKILGYIKRLPETWEGQPLRQQALDNFDEKFARRGNCQTETNFINYSFDWFTAKEQEDYWDKIYSLLMDGTIQLLPEEKKDEFVWTDELALEFSVSPYATISPLRDGLEQFKASKQRKPLFVTEDGKQIFEKDIFWTVNTSKFYIEKWICNIEENGSVEYLKYFSTEAAAREYVRLNKPMYSLNDVKKTWVEITGVFNLEVFIKELEKLKP